VFDPQATNTLVFDVLGTLLDEPAAFARAASAAAHAAGLSAEPLRERWKGAITTATDAIVAGQRPYAPPDVVAFETLTSLLAAEGVELPAADVRGWARYGHRLAPFPDAPAAFQRLGTDHRLVGLTNAGLSQALDMAAYADLRWHGLVSCELVQSYKPDPRTYEFVIQRFGVDPKASLFVAAHPWDLEAAAQHGFGTAFLVRSGERSDDFDLVAPDLGGLADLLATVEV
jgi:2-haloacid dehalogenase